MENLDTFAQSPQRTAGHYYRNNELAPEILKFIKEESDLRQFFTPKPMNGFLSRTYTVEKEEGIAVQIAGNSEVPREEDVTRYFTVYTHRNATGYKIDDDTRRMNKDDPGFETRKAEAAFRRLKKKEDKDIMNCFFASAQTVTTIPVGDAFDVESISDTVAAMITAARNGIHELTLEPDVILMPYQMFVELQKDPKFQFVPEIYQRILLDAKLVDGGNRGIHYGETGQTVAGLRIITVNELENTAIIIDSTQDAFWLNEDEAPRVSVYRDEEHISDIVDIRHDEQPVCVMPEVCGAIKKATN